MAGDSKAFTIPAGGTYPINGNGETYIFCQFADRPIRVKIAGKTVTMRAGGYQEFEPLAGPNARVEFENTDPDNPAAVVFIMGTGTYDEKIVRGEISIEPILRTADGTTKADTRDTLQINLQPVNLATKGYSIGDLIASFSVGGEPSPYTRERRLFQGPAGMVGIHINAAPGDFTTVQLYDQNTLNLVESFVIEATPYGFVQDVVYVNGLYYYLDNGGQIWDQNNNRVVDLVAVTGESGFTGMGYDPINQRFVLQDPADNAVWTVSALDFQTTTTFPLDLNAHVEPSVDCPRVDSWTGHYFIADVTALYEYSPDGEYIGTLDYSALDGLIRLDYGYQPYRNLLFADDNTIDGTTRYKRALRTYQEKPEFEAIRPGCGLSNAMVVPERMPQITADLSIQKLGDGILVSGEVIKAALEFYYKRKAPADYLDHVYQFDATRDGDGMPFKAINTGNRTFKRAAVSDNFSIQLPGKLVLVVDNELTMGAFI